MTDIDTLAAQLYDARAQERGPRWWQLGGTTRNVWRAIAAAQLFGDLA